jgi:hypothetical protein
MNKIIFLNGPAGSGKDSIGNFLVPKLNKASIYKFATPIKKAVAAMLNLSPEEYQFYFETPEGKNNPSVRFFGKTPRQWLISFSEDFAKKHGGTDVFGRIMATNLTPAFRTNMVENVVITDSGFQPEAEALINAFRGECEFFLIRLHRNGFKFEGDSRGYIYLEKENPNTVVALDIVNEEGRIEHAINKIIAELEWNDDELPDMFPDDQY